jgi:hypothetical protein
MVHDFTGGLNIMTRPAFIKSHSFVLLAVVLAFCIPLAVYAQSASATLSGTVEDQNGAIVPGVNVTVMNVDTSARRQVNTNESGSFTVPLLPPGRYTITARRDGFSPVEVPNLVLNVGDQKALNIQLKAGDVNAQVTVDSNAETTRTDGSVGTVVDRQLVANIPLNGRSFQSLIILSPGVVAVKSNFAEQGQFSINGQRANSNYYTVDGVSANFGINAGGGAGQAGAGELPALNASGGFSNLVSVDALQEFNIQTSTYAPEFGRGVGGQISLLTRSGTNQYHGSIFDYLRNDVLDATDWFVNARRLKKPALRQNDFGGVFGGPIRIPGFYNGHDKTFFFFSYEGLRLRQPLSAVTLVPSTSLRQVAPASVKPFLDAFSLPNGVDQGNGLAVAVASYSDPTTADATSIRVDHQMRKGSLFGRYNYAPSRSIARLGNGQLNNPRSAFFRTHTFTVGTTWIFNSRMSNEFRINYSHQDAGTVLTLDSFGGAVPITTAVIPSGVPPDDTFFSVTVINSTITIGRNGEGVQRQLNTLDNVSMVAGNHSLKFGIDFRLLNPSRLQRSADLAYTFPTIGSIGSNSVTPTINMSILARRSRVDYASRNYSAFAQDNWRATSRLMLTYGLRYDVNPAPYGRNDTVFLAPTQTDNPVTLAFAPVGTPLWETDKKNFAPRFGAAYRLTSAGSTVVRGGFGVFYDLPAGAISNVSSNPPSVAGGPTVNGVAFPPNSASIILPQLSLTGPFGSVLVADRNLKSPYTLQWNAAAEHLFKGNQILTLSYIGSSGHRLIRQERYPRANVNFPNLLINRSNAESSYNALQAQYQRRLSRVFQALASYTWSHSIDTASNDSTALPASTNINLAQERAASDFDVRHSFSGALTYDIPSCGSSVTKAIFGHWSADLVFTARSATPVDVVFSRDLGFGAFSFRPDLVQGIPLYLDDSTVGGGRRFNNSNVTARQVGPFLVPNDLRQGTLGRNALRGFSNNQLNFGVRRRIRLTERVGAQVRAELFNIFNHPNFADPSGSLGSVNAVNGSLTFSSATFGVSPSMLNTGLGTGGQVGGFNPLYGVGGPRSIQLSLKIEF